MSAIRQKGFTLVELLVALFIFALVAAAGVYSLRLGVEAREQLGEADDRLKELQISRMLMKEDLAQIVMRPVRDEFGESAGPAFLGGVETRLRPAVPDETLLLAFVRGGWTNPESAAPRSSLQYVEYVLKDGALLRRIRPYLDAARGQPVYERPLLSHVEDVEVGFLGGASSAGLVWLDGWPGTGGQGFPPRAVSLTVTTQRYRDLEQFFWIGDLAPPGADVR